MKFLHMFKIALICVNLIVWSKMHAINAPPDGEFAKQQTREYSSNANGKVVIKSRHPCSIASFSGARVVLIDYWESFLAFLWLLPLDSQMSIVLLYLKCFKFDFISISFAVCTQDSPFRLLNHSQLSDALNIGSIEFIFMFIQATQNKAICILFML